MSFSRFDVNTLLLTIIDILHKQIFMTFLNVVTKMYLDKFKKEHGPAFRRL